MLTCLVLRMGSRENMVPVTLALLLFPTMLWFLFIMGHLTNELGRAWSWGVASVICLSLGAAVYFLCVAMLTEPGLLFSHDPRSRSPRSFGRRGMIDDDDDDEDEEEEEEEEEEEDEDDNEGSYIEGCSRRKITHVLLYGYNMARGAHKIGRGPSHSTDVAPRVVEMKLLRAKFCRQTKACIWEFDHFCPWVGNAVGRRNYRSFIAFLTSVCVLDMAILVSTTVRIAAFVAKTTPAASTASSSDAGDDGASALGGFFSAVEDCTVASLLFALALIVFFSVCGLWLFHFWLISRGRTTNENIKGTWWRERNPHDRGCLRNWMTFLTRPIPASQLHVTSQSSETSDLLCNIDFDDLDGAILSGLAADQLGDLEMGEAG